MVMSKSLLLESYLLLSGDGQRQLQQLPDYTSPPLEDALKTTPEVFRSDDVIQLARDLDAAGNCTVDGNRCHIPFEPPLDEFEAPSRVGVVFYNGGLVDPRGYSPLAMLLNERYGIPVVIPIFASDLAFKFGTCDSGRLDFAKAEFPEVEKWILAGHSFGGVAAMVDMWARWNAKDESAAGLALLAADVQQGLGCGETDFSGSGLPMAQVLAANDGILNSTRVALNSAFKSNATFDMEIYGANHASFGTYDSSRRFELFGQVDGEALVSDSMVRDLAGGAIASVAIRTGVPLATRKESAPDEDSSEAEESSGFTCLKHGGPLVTFTLLSWNLVAFTVW
eukprot:CAMPEP_0196137040 /NCGR_PEP_ID=MMETSP0910-20130528/5151_1 /TAXON_ID=49265 /ORGANISM="Thalassiosira rotula, Strain GSO102" /LENGTH=337 /DNA_ID=CAMNT_0041397427 /DNA_START=26 /DNA_END=1036 /DNA_ORIENTATION=-